MKYKTGTCKEKLSAAGLVCRELEENRLVSLYASFFGGHVEADADYLSLVSLLQLAEEERTGFDKAREKLKLYAEAKEIAGATGKDDWKKK